MKLGMILHLETVPFIYILIVESSRLFGSPKVGDILQIVALGNLLPPDAETDELDSWMYQTVGHQLVGAYAAATGLPLIRRRIFGHSKHTVRDCYCHHILEYSGIK